MDELKKRLSQKKRCRPQSPTKSEVNIKQKYVLNNENSEYFITLKLFIEKNKIIIKCYPRTSEVKYEASFQLEELKEKNRIFNVCKNLEDAYKIFMNILNKKKAKVVDNNNESVNLILAIPNYIDNVEENISFNLIKIINFNGVMYDEAEASKMINDMFKDSKTANFGIHLVKKIITLSRKDSEKDTQIRKLIIHLNKSLEALNDIKKDIKKIKKHVGMSDNSEKDEDNDEDDEEEDKINEEEDEIEDYEEEEKDSKFKFNEEKEEDYENNKEDIENLKEKLKYNIIKLNESKISKEKDEEEKMNLSNKINLHNSEIRINSNNSNNSNNLNCFSPQLSFYKNLTKKTTSKYYGDNNFTVFESRNKEIILVYSTSHNSIHFYDIEQDKLLKNIQEAHKSQITNFRYVLDKNLNRDLLLSISDKIKNIKIWDIKYYNCILNIEKAYNDGFLFSACFLIDEINKKGYILCVNYNSEPLKIFNFEGNNVRNINNCEDQSYIVDTFFNSYQKKYYIIVGNENFIISYNFEEGIVYKRYYDNTTNNCLHMFFTVNSKEADVYLIEADLLGYVRIWNFDTGILLKKYLIGQKLKLRGICLWDDNYLFVGASDRKVKLIDLKNGDIIDNLKCNESVCTIKKINSYKYGECLLLQGKSNNGQIKLWKNIN